MLQNYILHLYDKFVFISVTVNEQLDRYEFRRSGGVAHRRIVSLEFRRGAYAKEANISSLLRLLQPALS